MPDYFRCRTIRAADKKASLVLTQKYTMNSVIFFSGIGCFKGMFTLQVKDGSTLYKMPPRRIAYAFQETPKKELDRLQKQ